MRLTPFLSNNPLHVRMSVPMPYTIFSFLTGERSEAAKVIYANPFYNDVATRDSAEFLVQHFGLPVLRRSSRPGLYAATYYCLTRRTLIHTLLRQNADLSIDVLTNAGVPCEHYADIYELLALVIWGRHPTPLTEMAPALLPLLPAVVRSGPVGDDDDPVTL